MFLLFARSDYSFSVLGIVVALPWLVRFLSIRLILLLLRELLVNLHAGLGSIISHLFSVFFIVAPITLREVDVLGNHGGAIYLLDIFRLIGNLHSLLLPRLT